MLRRDDYAEVFARLGPGRDAVRATRVCVAWDNALLLPSTYNRMVATGQKPRNRFIFGANSGLDPNNPTGYQGKLAEYEDREPCIALRRKLKECDNVKRLVRLLDSAPSFMVRDVALNLYLRFDHNPLWTICGNAAIRDTEQEEMIRILLIVGAQVDLTGGSGVRTTPLQEAARINRPRAVQMLLLGGAVVDKYGGSFQQTPLALVCGLANSSLDLVHRFVAAGADIGAVDEDGLLPIHRAMLARSLPVFNYFARLLHWKSDEDSRMDRPSLLHFSDVNFHLLPTLEKAFDMCVISDWGDGLQLLAPSMPNEGRDRARDILKLGNYYRPEVERWLMAHDSTPGLGILRLVFHDDCLDLAVKQQAYLKTVDPLDLLERALCGRAWTVLRFLMKIGIFAGLSLLQMYMEHLAAKRPFYSNSYRVAERVEVEDTIASPKEWHENCELGKYSSETALNLLLASECKGRNLVLCLLFLVSKYPPANLLERLASDGKHRLSDVAVLNFCLQSANVLKCNDKGDSVLHVLLLTGNCDDAELRQVMRKLDGKTNPRELRNASYETPMDVAATPEDLNLFLLCCPAELGAEEDDDAARYYRGDYRSVDMYEEVDSDTIQRAISYVRSATANHLAAFKRLLEAEADSILVPVEKHVSEDEGNDDAGRSAEDEDNHSESSSEEAQAGEG